MREGWHVRTNLRAGLADIVGMVREDYYDVVGLSASGEALLDNLQLAIVSIRTESLNPDVKILVGGVLFALRPELAKELKVDGCATDPRIAVDLARAWIAPGSSNRALLS